MAIQSTGLGVGVMITMASYCNIRNPVNMDAITLNIVDIFTCVTCGIFCYNCYGIIGYHYGIQPITLLQTGYNIPFVIVPEALAFIPGSANFWSLVFFSTIFCFGISTEYFTMASNLSIIYDRFPRTMEYPVVVSGGACFLLFLLGLPFCTTNGTNFATLMDTFVSGTLQATIVTIQIFIVLWVYALSRFSDDVHFMLGFRPSSFCQGCWFLAPLVSLVAVIFEFQRTHERVNTSNRNLEMMCWIMVYIVPLSVVVLVGVVNFIRFYSKKKLRQVTKPDPDYGPNDPVLMKSRRMFSAQAMTKEYMYRQSRLGTHGRNLTQTSSDMGSQYD